MLSEEKKSWLATVLKVSVDGSGPIGMVSKSKHEKYKDEEKKVGWRNTLSEKATNETHVVTQHYSEEERKANTVKISDGQATTDNSKDLDRVNIYSMDPKTGEVVLGHGDGRLMDLDPEGKPTGKSVQKSWNQGTEIARKSKEKMRYEAMHHTTLVQGEDVGGAGEVTFDKSGKITKINNSSGHYAPQMEFLLQTVEHLMSQGMLLDHTIVDHTGTPLPPDSAPVKLYKKVVPLVAELPKAKLKISKMLDTLLNGELSDEAYTQIVEAGDKMIERIETIEKAIGVLRQMGVGPSMKIDETAEVGLISAGKSATGKEVKLATEDVMSVKTFLMGEGAPATRGRTEEPEGNKPGGDTGIDPGKEDLTDEDLLQRAQLREMQISQNIEEEGLPTQTEETGAQPDKENTRTQAVDDKTDDTVQIFEKDEDPVKKITTQTGGDDEKQSGLTNLKDFEKYTSQTGGYEETPYDEKQSGLANAEVFKKYTTQTGGYEETSYEEKQSGVKGKGGLDDWASTTEAGSEEETSNGDEQTQSLAPKPPKPHRDGSQMGTLLDEIRSATKDRRPENRPQTKDVSEDSSVPKDRREQILANEKTVMESEAPEVNPEEWAKDVDVMSQALDDLASDRRTYIKGDDNGAGDDVQDEPRGEMGDHTTSEPPEDGRTGLEDNGLSPIDEESSEEGEGGSDDGDTGNPYLVLGGAYDHLSNKNR